MANVSTLIDDALKTSGIVGVGQQALAEDTNRAFRLLNRLLAEWRRQRMFVYRTQDVSFVGTGAQTYTIGTGGGATINVSRPARIDAAFVRNLNSGVYPVDSPPMTVLRAREDYNRIQAKTIGPYPTLLYYDPTFPNGTIYAWPVPSSLYEVHMTILGDLVAFASVNDQISLPDEYENALYWNLASSVRTAYRRPPDEGIERKASNARDVLKKANLQIPSLSMPSGIPVAYPRYNILSDQGF